jgi:hypothetical protein
LRDDEVWLGGPMNGVALLMLMGAELDAGGDGEMAEWRMDERRAGGGGAPDGDDDGNCGESDDEDGIVLKGTGAWEEASAVGVVLGEQMRRVWRGGVRADERRRW